MVIAIVGLLAGLAIPAYLGYLDKARIARCIAEIRYIEKSVKAFCFGSDAYPNNLTEAGADQMVDPWGTPYQYLKLAGAGPGNGGGQGGGQGGGGGNNAWWWFEPASAFGAPPSQAGGPQGSGAQGGGPPLHPRKDRFLVPINSDFDLYSMGKDRETVAPLTAKKSHDDIVRANDGAFVGLASEF